MYARREDFETREIKKDTGTHRRTGLLDQQRDTRNDTFFDRE